MCVIQVLARHLILGRGLDPKSISLPKQVGTQNICGLGPISRISYS